MNIDFDDNKTISISMKKYIKNTIADFSEDIIRNAATPAAKHLFNTSDKGNMLCPEEHADIFQNSSKATVCKRACLDILLAVAFLCT